MKRQLTEVYVILITLLFAILLSCTTVQKNNYDLYSKITDTHGWLPSIIEGHWDFAISMEDKEFENPDLNVQKYNIEDGNRMDYIKKWINIDDYLAWKETIN